jgi:putative PIN family toxin of toxin-antitoxin system
MATTRSVIVALLDTNIWVSGFLVPQGHSAKVIRAWREQKFVVVVSEALLREIEAVLSRPRIRKKFVVSDEAGAVLIQTIRQHAKIVEPTGKLKICRDPKDDAILETAILGGARYTVSRDEDLTRDAHLRETLTQYNIEPITVQHFIELLAQW